MTEISCIICVYNEGERVRAILGAALHHPALSEIIVVNDGSTDETATVLAAYPGVKVISYPANRGKTYAMAQGIAAASGDYLMFLDADLEGVEPRHIDALADPVRRARPTPLSACAPTAWASTGGWGWISSRVSG